MPLLVRQYLVFAPVLASRAPMSTDTLVRPFSLSFLVVECFSVGSVVRAGFEWRSTIPLVADADAFSVVAKTFANQCI